jgi:hypothetical protein
MGQLKPIFTAENIHVAYQLIWSLTLFWKSPPGTDDWLVPLAIATEADDVWILRHRFEIDDCSLFLVSTKPHVRPSDVARFVKGRLQHLVRDRWPKAFQCNYDLRSVGSTKRDKLEAYVTAQVTHHLQREERLRAVFADLQIVNPHVDLSRWRVTSHARFWTNLHLILVRDWRWCERRPEVWLQVREMIRRVGLKKQHLLSRVGLVPDHLHMTLGTGTGESPLEVALTYMNNIAFVHGMKPVFMKSCYLGTFGEYDLGAIRGGASP